MTTCKYLTELLQTLKFGTSGKCIGANQSGNIANHLCRHYVTFLSVHHSLSTVTGLRKGRTTAPETAPVEPVDRVDKAKDEGISRNILWKAKKELGVLDWKEGFGCPIKWSLERVGEQDPNKMF